MQQTVPPGFQVLSSPAYQAVILNAVSKVELKALCNQLDQHIKSYGYQVEDWSTNPVFIVNPGGWVLPSVQRHIVDWVLEHSECKYLRTVRGKNMRLETMRLEFLNEGRVAIDLRELQIG
jgi:hypothetical protein